jgi:hypothetical protein
MQQGPSREADSRSASREIPRLLSSPKVRYRVHMGLLLALILNQVNPEHSFTPYLSNIHFNIILTSKPKSLKSFFPGFRTEMLYNFLIFPMHATFSAHLIFLYLMALIIFGEE